MFVSSTYNTYAVSNDNELFEGFEIRVIRPRYFIKNKKYELGVAIGQITNEVYTSSSLTSLHFSYHMTNDFNVELNIQNITTRDLNNKKDLQNEFYISTPIQKQNSIY